MGLPDILKVHFFLIPMMYVLCLVGFCPGILDIWLTTSDCQNRNFRGFGCRKTLNDRLPSFTWSFGLLFSIFLSVAIVAVRICQHQTSVNFSSVNLTNGDGFSAPQSTQWHNIMLWNPDSRIWRRPYQEPIQNGICSGVATGWTCPPHFC